MNSLRSGYTPRRISCLCLGAGRSSRMGQGHKLLKKLGEYSVISHVLRQACSFPEALTEVLLVTGARGDEVGSEALRYPVRIIPNKNFASGVHSSLRVGIENLGDVDGVIVCLGDQPFHLKARIEALLKEPLDRTSLVRSEVKSMPGHPVFIGRDYWSEILSEPDRDQGAGYLFKRHPYTPVEQSEAALWDLDTPEDFMRFQHESGLF